MDDYPSAKEEMPADQDFAMLLHDLTLQCFYMIYDSRLSNASTGSTIQDWKNNKSDSRLLSLPRHLDISRHQAHVADLKHRMIRPLSIRGGSQLFLIWPISRLTGGTQPQFSSEPAISPPRVERHSIRERDMTQQRIRQI